MIEAGDTLNTVAGIARRTLDGFGNRDYLTRGGRIGTEIPDIMERFEVSMRFSYWLVVLAAALFLATAQTVQKFGVQVRSGPMDSILLKDYVPSSSLVVPQTQVAKAAFPVIDVHTHTGQSDVRTPQDVAGWVKTMDEVGIEMTVVFTGATGAQFGRQVELFRPHANRFQLWCNLDTTDIGAPGYAERAAKELDRCYRLGARGIGELTDKGSGMQRAELPRAARLHPDDPRLDMVWKKCAELKIPVNLHIADHPSCWQPLGPKQERTPDFQHFNLYGKDVLSHEELMERRNRLLEKHPNTTFIFCHLSNQGHNLAELAKALDRYPNMFVDISARDYEVGRQPRTAARFLARYRDRVLFGTDMQRAPEMYRGWWRLLETEDEFIPGRIWWAYYGLKLTPEVLEPLYRGNARRLLNWQ